MLYLGQLFVTSESPQAAPRFVWEVDNWVRLERFLILGSEDGAYSVGDRELKIENAGAVRACLRQDGLRLVRTVVERSNSGRAPKNAPALFTLALACSPQFADPETNAAALHALPKVARTGTDLCVFAAFASSMRGWGRGLRSAIADWYLKKTPGELADEIMKQEQHGEWSHRDLLRMSHPQAETAAHHALFQWTLDGELGHWASPEVLAGELRPVRAFESAKKAVSESEIVQLIEDYRLTYEMIPAQWKNSARVWEALLDSMPYGALVQHLGKLTSVGLLAPQSPETALAVARLIDRKRVANSRLHPIDLLAAWLSYQQGRDETKSLEWEPVAGVTGALERAFYLAFDHVEPSAKRIYLAIDASPSMERSRCEGMRSVPVATASAGLAMAFARAEPHCRVAAFHERLWHVDIARQDRLDRVCEAISHEPGGANASLPIEDALRRGLAVDAFVIVTDSKSWFGDQHPGHALERYRRLTGIATKLVVVAMAAGRNGMTDSNDAFQLAVTGFHASVPAVVSDFIRGRFP